MYQGYHWHRNRCEWGPLCREAEKQEVVKIWRIEWYGYGSIPIDTFLAGWTSIYQLFWCSPGVQGFDTLPYVPPCYIYHVPKINIWGYVFVWKQYMKSSGKLRDGQRLQNLRQPQIPHLAGPSTCGWKWVVPYMRCFIIIVSISNNVKCCFIAETPTLSYLHPTSNPSLERSMIFGSQGPRRTARPHREDGTGMKNPVPWNV
jgi:hypothetical protein